MYAAGTAWERAVFPRDKPQERMVAISQEVFENVLSLLARAIVLLTAMPVHECAHGFVADKLGDDTARRQGRLTLNPVKHLDLMGSLLLILAGFGWAKPVQVNPRNFQKPKRDMALTALAGPVSNILLALVVMVLYKVSLHVLDIPALRYSMWPSMLLLVPYYMVIINLYLAVFNLLPVPPLDGSKIFGVVLPEEVYFGMMRYQRVITLILFVLLFTGRLQIPLQTMAGWVLSFLDFITLPIDILFYTMAA